METCPEGGTLEESVDDGTGSETIRHCSCGFLSTGPDAPASYADHLLGLI